MDRDDLMMTARLAVQVVAGMLIARGLLDAATAEALVGLVVFLVGWWASRRSRRRLRARALSAEAALGMVREHIPPRA